MLINARKLIGCAVHATDGDAGEIKSLYLDSRQWKIRYCAVETGGWLSSRQVLIAPEAFSPRDASWEKADVNMTREQVENCPNTNLDLPVSQAAENEMAIYYPPSGSAQEEIRMNVVEQGRAAFVQTPAGTTMTARAVPDARFLFSSRDLRNFDIQATDGTIGDIEDFIVDDRSWSLRYLAIDASSWMSGKKVLVPCQLIETIDERNRVVRIDQSKEALKNAPAYDPSHAVEPQQERDLDAYYGRFAAAPSYVRWRFENKIMSMPSGSGLRIEVFAPAVVHWSADGWKTVNETRTRDTGRGVHVAELNTAGLHPGASVHFTFFWARANHWENQNFSVKVEAGARERQPAAAGV
jgi:hypothetical protein